MRMLGTSKFAKCKLAKDNRINPRRDELSEEIIRIVYRRSEVRSNEGVND